MNPPKYPLVEALGVIVHCPASTSPYIYAADLERILAAAPVVHWEQDEKSRRSWPSWAQTTNDTHSGRLLCVSEIKRDTAESLLREFVGVHSGQHEHVTVASILDRARKLLGQGG